MEKQFKVEIPRKNRPELEFYTNLEERKAIQEYMDNYDFMTDVSEKFNETDHGRNICVICGKEARNLVDGKYFCIRHNSQLKRYGSLRPFTKGTTPNQIKFYSDKVSIVTRSNLGDITGEFFINKESVLKVLDYRWHEFNGYCAKSVLTPHRFLHRLLMIKDSVDSRIIDHVDQNRANNLLSNLRIVTVQENRKNAMLAKTNKTGFAGVFFYKRINKYCVFLRDEEYTIPTLSYDTLFEAVTARLTAEYHIIKEGFAPQRHLFNDYPINKSIKDIKLYYHELKRERGNGLITGVDYDEKTKSYGANLLHKGSVVLCRYFKDVEDAIRCRLQVEMNIFGLENSPQSYLFEEYNITHEKPNYLKDLDIARSEKTKFGVKGVTYSERDNMYVVRFSYRKKLILATSFKTLHEAQVARLQAEVDNLPLGHKSRQEHLYEKFGIISK